MGYMVLDTNFEVVRIVEGYDSIIWTDRYDKYGDFEVYVGLTTDAVSAFKEDYYLWSDDSEHVMIIEDLEIESSEEDGIFLKVTGRSLESILLRRIVWSLTTKSGNLQSVIQQLLIENIIVEGDPSRKIPNFVFLPSTDPKVTSLSIEAIQFRGEYVYDLVSSMCSSGGIGFKITLSEDNKFIFQLYAGVDRSYDQVTNPRVIFSRSYDNLGASKYLASKRPFKNLVLVGGEGEGAAKRLTYVIRPGGHGDGLNRRETYIDSSVSSSDITDTQYDSLLKLDGTRALEQASKVSAFDGEILSTENFQYPVDFGMGDIVQLEDTYIDEAQSKSRVIEFIRSHDANGYKAYPTLQSV